jgi:YqjK-like protein
LSKNIENVMHKKLQNIAQRRAQLIEKSAQQRLQLAQISAQWRTPLAYADKGLALINLVKKHPIWVAGGSALILKLLRPKRIGKWLGRGLTAWQIARKLRSKFLA